MSDQPRVTSTAIRLPKELHDELTEAARARTVSVNWMVNRAVEDFLRRLIPVDELRLTRDREQIEVTQPGDLEPVFAPGPLPLIGPWQGELPEWPIQPAGDGLPH